MWYIQFCAEFSVRFRNTFQNKKRFILYVDVWIHKEIFEITKLIFEETFSLSNGNITAVIKGRFSSKLKTNEINEKQIEIYHWNCEKNIEIVVRFKKQLK